MGDTPRASALLTGVFGARSIPGAVLSSVGFSRQGSKQLHKGIREIPAGKLCQPFPKCCGWAVALLLLHRHRAEQCQHRGCPRSSAVQGSVQPHTAPCSPIQPHAAPAPWPHHCCSSHNQQLSPSLSPPSTTKTGTEGSERSRNGAAGRSAFTCALS